MGEKRVIEQIASSEVFTDDWFLKDSALNGTTKINLANLRSAILNGMDLSKIEDDIAPEFSTSVAYTKDDIVLYEDALFIFIADKAAGDWDTNKVTGTSIGALIESIESRIDNLTLADLGDDSTHRTVTDTEKSTWSAKQDALTFDDVPTDNSNNPVKSNGIYDALATKANSADLATVATSGSASDVSFDNSNTELESTNVQDAIVEVLDEAGKVDDIVSHGQSLVENKVADLSSLTAVGTASGDIATFPDGSDLPMPKLEVGIEPVQDLHGYDAPWVGGAGKNKLPMTVEGIKAVNTYHPWSGNSTTINNVTITIETSNSGDVTGIRFNGTASADITFNIATNISIPNGSYIWSNDQTVNISNLWLSLASPNVAITLSTQKEVNVTISSDSIGSAYIYASSGNVFNNIVFKPMIRLASVSDDTFAPYSNICPISGWNGANVGVVGVNQWDEEWESGSLDETTGEKVPNGYMIRSKNYIPIKANTSYYIKYYASGLSDSNFVICYYGKDKTFISSETNREVITTPPNAFFMMFRCVTQYGTTYNNDISINYPSTDTEYHAYNGQTITIQLGDTYYWCKLDVVSGLLTVLGVGVDLGDLTWSGSLSAYHYYTTLSIPYKWANNTQFICSKYKFDGRETGGNYYGVSGTFRYWYSEGGAQVYEIYLCDGTHTFSSFTEVKEYLSGTMLVYELATPLTIQLTPTQVKSLQGINNVFADAGAILDAEYIRDLTTIIDYILEQLNA